MKIFRLSDTKIWTNLKLEKDSKQPNHMRVKMASHVYIKEKIENNNRSIALCSK